MTLDKPLDPGLPDLFQGGMTLESGEVCLPAQLEITGNRQAAVVLHQGMYHQVKRMFAACGYHVEALHRSAMGGVLLDPGLAPGECRELTPEEVAALETGQIPQNT